MAEKVESFSKRLRIGLDRKSMTQTELSIRSGVSKSSISRYLKGDWEGKQEAVYALAGALGVSVSWLMGYDVPITGVEAPGTIVGLTRGCNKNHIIRATLDSLCYQVNDVLHAMEADSGIAMKALKVDGGACANNYLMQTMADISNLPVERPCCVETTALGAAYLAGLAVGYWSSTDEVVKNWSVDRTFLPQITAEERAKRIKGWNKAVRCSYHWALDEEES